MMKFYTFAIIGLLLTIFMVPLVAPFINIGIISNKLAWDNEYEKITINEPVYKEVCYLSKLEVNGTFHKAYCIDEFDRYEEKTIITKNVIGITDGNTIIKNAYKEGEKISVWNVPIGDRNFEEFGKCREYEIRKGVCNEK